MNNSLTNDFEKFIKSISLNDTLIDDIISKHNSLSEMIINNPPTGYKIYKKRLSGSYAKHIVLNETDKTKKPDVDMILIIETDEEDIFTISNDFLEYLKDKKGKVVVEVRQQSNSIGILYKNIDVDIVLAKIDDKNDENKIRIVSTKNNSWIPSNCLKQIEFMKEQSKRYAFDYRGLMKLFKYLNKERLNNSLKSYTLEMLIHKCVPAPKVGQRIFQVFVDTLDNITKIDDISQIKDCCDNNKLGYDAKDALIFQSFKNEISCICECAKAALNGDRKKWEEIFGDKFPIQPQEKVENNNIYDKSQTPWCYE